MLNAFIWLLLLSVAMLVASFVAGCIPLATKLSDAKLSFLTSLSVGLLISTSLVVIIPEGVETLYDNSKVNLQSDLDDGLEKSQHAVLENHTAIGLSLLVGFAVMFIIDQVSSMHVHPSAASTTTSTNTNNKNRNSLELDAMLKGSSTQNNNHNNSESSTSTLIDSHAAANTNTTITTTTTNMEMHQPIATPTIGLIVHAAADGIALGASATHPQLSMVVFFAIMLHKAPSAFALTTVLLSEGISRSRVRQHLLMFSLAAPAGAISTYILLQLFSDASTSSVNLEYWTGILLLFSGGTFLYVAMHAIQELKSNHHYNHNHEESTVKSTDWNQLGSIMLGMFIPFVLNFNHSH